MTPQKPFKGKYQLTQDYYQNLSNYPEGKHGGHDYVPKNSQGFHYPAEIYPILPGVATVITDTDAVRGKGIKVRTDLDSGFIYYLKRKGLIPKGTLGNIYLDTLYWHCLEVLDKDGIVTRDPIAKAGNTGRVFTQGKPVPDSQKGKPPYPGLHLHLECVLHSEIKNLNLDRDPYGRIDPFIILNYKAMQFKTQNYKGELRIVLQASTPEQWDALCEVYGADSTHIDETVS